MRLLQSDILPLVGAILCFTFFASSMTSCAQAQSKAEPGSKAPLATSGQKPVVDAKTGQMTFTSASGEKNLKSFEGKTLKRLDFRVEGSSCASCLGRIRKRVDALEGVAMVAVAIKAPYGVAVIYDPGKLDKDKILAAGKHEEKDVRFLDMQESNIDKLPIVLWPKYNSLQK